MFVCELGKHESPARREEFEEFLKKNGLAQHLNAASAGFFDVRDHTKPGVELHAVPVRREVLEAVRNFPRSMPEKMATIDLLGANEHLYENPSWKEQLAARVLGKNWRKLAVKK